MSSVVTIGFLDRTQVSVHVEITPPLADDERREVLFHVALMTARTFASLPPDRQIAFAGMLREWIADAFRSCPIQLFTADPMVCLPRFASSFLAPTREYALATRGCEPTGEGIEYFLPMATAGFLRHIHATYQHADELLEPGFALCGAALIQPVTMANHFQVAAAALPKVGPMPDRSESDLVPPRPSDRSFVKPLAIPPALKRLREIRRSRILSACIAALVIVSAVQYFSTVRQEEDIVDRESSLPPVATTPTRELSQALVMNVSPESVRPEPAPTVDSTAAMTSKVANAEDQAYQRFARDIAERSLAHAEVMLKAVERRILISHDLTDTLDYGTAQLKKGLDHCTSTVPPAIYQEVHTKICHALSDLLNIGEELHRSPLPHAHQRTTQHLSEMQRLLEDLLVTVDDI